MIRCPLHQSGVQSLSVSELQHCAATLTDASSGLTGVSSTINYRFKHVIGSLHDGWTINIDINIRPSIHKTCRGAHLLRYGQKQVVICCLQHCTFTLPVDAQTPGVELESAWQVGV